MVVIKNCTYCKGRGKKVVNPGKYQVEVPCKKCHGKGVK